MGNEYLNNAKFEAIIEAFQMSKRKKLQYQLIIDDLQETHQRKLKVYNDAHKLELLTAQKECYEDICRDFNEYREKLAYAFYLIASNLATYRRYTGVDIDDATQEGVLTCFEKVDKFDRRKGKAFAYMTTCVDNQYRQMYRSTKNHNELKKRYYKHLQDKFEKQFYRNGRGAVNRNPFEEKHSDFGG